MASTFKSKVTSNIGTSATIVYTGVAATQATIIGLSLCNTSGAGVTVDVTYVKGGVTVYVGKTLPIPVGSSLVIVGGDQKLIVETSDTLQVKSSAATSIDVLLSVLEIA
jgi:hypothetical protein